MLHAGVYHVYGMQCSVHVADAWFRVSFSTPSSSGACVLLIVPSLLYKSLQHDLIRFGSFHGWLSQQLVEGHSSLHHKLPGLWQATMLSAVGLVPWYLLTLSILTVTTTVMLLTVLFAGDGTSKVLLGDLPVQY